MVQSISGTISFPLQGSTSLLGPDPAFFREMHRETDLAVRTTKTMANLVVLEHHLWLNLLEIKDADKAAFLDSLVSPTGLFVSVVDGFIERFSAAQKRFTALGAVRMLRQVRYLKCRREVCMLIIIIIISDVVKFFPGTSAPHRDKNISTF